MLSRLIFPTVIIFLLILTVVLVIISYQPFIQIIQPSKDIVKQNAKFNNKPETTLALLPDFVTLAATDSAEVMVTIDTKANQVNFVQVELVYDPTQIEAYDFSPESLFNNQAVLLNDHDEGYGTLSYAIAPSGETDTFQGEATIARFRVKASPQATATHSTVKFSNKSLILTPNSRSSILKNMSSLNVVIIPAIATPSATPLAAF